MGRLRGSEALYLYLFCSRRGFSLSSGFELVERSFESALDGVHRLAREQPDRPILTSLEGVLQARSAGEIPLLQRVSWVEEAIRFLRCSGAIRTGHGMALGFSVNERSSRGGI